MWNSQLNKGGWSKIVRAIKARQQDNNKLQTLKNMADSAVRILSFFSLWPSSATASVMFYPYFKSWTMRLSQAGLK